MCSKVQSSERDLDDMPHIDRKGNVLCLHFKSTFHHYFAVSALNLVI